MSWTHLTTINVKSARKDHYCDACQAILDGDSIQNIKKELSPNELTVFEKMESQKFKILKGQPYTKVTGIYDGDLCTAKYADGMYNIGERLGIFED